MIHCSWLELASSCSRIVGRPTLRIVLPIVMTSRLSASTPSAWQRRGYGCIEVSFGGSGGAHLGHACARRARGDKERQLPQRVLLAGGLDRPPDRVAAGEARDQ